MTKFERAVISVLSVCIIFLIIEPFLWEVDWSSWLAAIIFSIGSLAVFLYAIYIE